MTSNIDWVAVLVRAAKAAAPTAHPKRWIVNGMADHLPAMFEHFGITTPRRQAHFVSEVCIECDYFQTLEEYASGAAYEGRHDLGNVQPGDGRKFKGRAPLQVTGRANYAQAQKDLKALGFNCDLLNHPEQLAEDVKLATWACGVWWQRNHMNAVADSDATGRRVARAVNRGNPNSEKPANHEAERMRAFALTAAILANPPKAAPTAIAKETHMPTASQGLPIAATPAEPAALPWYRSPVFTGALVAFGSSIAATWQLYKPGVPVTSQLDTLWPPVAAALGSLLAAYKRAVAGAQPITATQGAADKIVAEQPSLAVPGPISDPSFLPLHELPLEKLPLDKLVAELPTVINMLGTVTSMAGGLSALVAIAGQAAGQVTRQEGPQP